jgi:two-component system phosphate regulon sensor histidine kinase PhoR
MYSLQQCENDFYTKTINVAEIDKNLRTKLQDKNIRMITNMQMKSIFNDSIGSKAGYDFDSFLIREMEAPAVKLDAVHPDSILNYIKLKYLDSLFNQENQIHVDSMLNYSNDLKKYSFKVESSGRTQDIYDAYDRFIINEKCPFTTERLDSLLRDNGLIPTSIQIETTDSMIWNHDKIRRSSIFRPVLEVTYPFDILQKQQFRVSYHLSVSAIFERMLASFICSVILSFLLIFCLIYQINTIFRQQRIEELRKNFVHTMIHELKRPITALKLCISFVKNDKLMKDNKMKEEIIGNAHNELDNLSSYFSKLRDVMVDDLKNIPLNLSTFNLKELVEHCIEKQFLPSDRTVDIKVDFENDDFEITADRMYIGNILCNLLENAIKYSEGQTVILIDCRFAGDKYRLEVSDNGTGISDTERNYVFDRFFRSANVAKKDIHGMGLGLYYVKLLVRAHRGNVFLHSVLGEGSTFTVEIPKKQ